MTGSALVGLALLALAALLAVLAAVVAGQRARRLRRERRRAVVADPLRPLLLELAAGEPSEAEQALQRLVLLDDGTWAALEPDVESLLLKVRGETKGAVVGLLERRGALARAVAQTRSRSGVRRAHGAEVLGAAGRQSALPDLVRLLQDPEPEVRQVAARALGRIGAAGAASALLVALSADRSIPPRIVATAIARIGVGAYPALEAALRRGDDLQRAVAAEIAGLTGAVGTTSALLGLLADDPELEVRIRSARALGRIGAPYAVDRLLAVVSAGEPTALRAVAARALGDLGDARAVPVLAELVTNPAHRVAANAAVALTRCGTGGLRALRECATSPEGAHAREALAAASLRGLDASAGDRDEAPEPAPGTAPAWGPA